MKSFWSDEFERMSRMVRDLMQSPAQNLLREIEQRRQLLEPPGYRALREIQDNIAADARRVNEGLTSGFSSLLGQYDVLKSIVAAHSPSSLAFDLQRSFLAYQPPPLPFIESLADQLRSASLNLEAFHQFEETFAGQLLGLARKVVEAPEEALEERADDLTGFLGTHLSESKRGPISLEGYVQIVLAVLLYIYSAIGAQQSEERIAKRLNTLESRLKVIVPSEKVERAPDLRLVSAASLRVRAEAATDSRIIGKLTRNSLVRVIDKKKNWAHIEYFDFIDGRARTGWVAHRFLQELSDNFGQGTHARRTAVEKQVARKRFERHFGEVDLGFATGVDNEQIDADLAREYAATPEH